MAENEFVRGKKAAGHKLLQLDFYDNNDLCTVIYADYDDKTVSVENHTDNFIKRAFGVKQNITWEMYMNFLEDRCVPKQRMNIQYYLEAIGLYEYDPLQIILHTKGKMAEDHQWLEVTEL